MDRLAQILFPNNPKRVRQRKMQMMYFAVAIGFLSCVFVGAAMYFMGRGR